MAESRIDTGDTVRCETCRRRCTVRTYEWEVPVHVIVCEEGITIVGVEHEEVPQHLLVDYRHLEELV